jgi:phosphoribosylanthranilate isomerase
MFLLDSNAREKYGGTGRTFDWNLAQPIARQFPVIIAGGLKPANVAQAIKQISPWGVDVSTGVETRGVKDMKKIRKFIEAVRKTDAG